MMSAGPEHEAVISVGSNVDPAENVARARRRLRKQHKVLAESVFVYTKPIGSTAQPDFLNGVIRIRTRLNRRQLKLWLQEQETSLGRVHTEDKYGPRTMDLDIVVWDGMIVDPDVYSRDFLRTAIQEVWPDLDLAER